MNIIDFNLLTSTYGINNFTVPPKAERAGVCAGVYQFAGWGDGVDGAVREVDLHLRPN